MPLTVKNVTMGKQKKKLDAYSRWVNQKFNHEDDQVITTASKLEIKNANRSLKKGKRQQLKTELKKYMEDLNDGNP